MNKRDLEKLVAIEAELREAGLKLFLVFNAVSTRVDKLRKLVRRLQEKAVKDEHT